jgi:hypothetical protein
MRYYRFRCINKPPQGKTNAGCSQQGKIDAGCYQQFGTAMAVAIALRTRNPIWAAPMKVGVVFALHNPWAKPVIAATAFEL